VTALSDSPPTNSVVVACAADEAFAVPLAILVRSIRDHLDPARRLDLYIVDIGITQPTKERLTRSWPADRLDLHWLAVDPKALSHLPVWGRMNIATYQRLLMGQLLPEGISRVIWLDCDAVVMTDLTELWSTPLEGNTIAAAQDIVVPFVSSRFGVGRFRELGLPPDALHFNAGVMLVDLDVWRAGHVAEQSFEYLDRHAQEVWFWDQEALNVVLIGRWKLLDPRWNHIASVAGRWFFRQAHLDAQTYQQMVDSPWLVHWAGMIKPWKFRGRRPVHRNWFDLLDRTDWRGWRPPRTMSSVALGIYDAWARNLFYPFESWLLKAQRRRVR
jgi:lipopolysaccharide biosynthesis glycosyltransferase